MLDSERDVAMALNISNDDNDDEDASSSSSLFGPSDDSLPLTNSSPLPMSPSLLIPAQRPSRSRRSTTPRHVQVQSQTKKRRGTNKRSRKEGDKHSASRAALSKGASDKVHDVSTTLSTLTSTLASTSTNEALAPAALAPPSRTTTTPTTTSTGLETGCLTCRADDDHANLMLCEGCNDEYHTYCLDPPLRSVPQNDWFCDNCKPQFDTDENDGLDHMVAALNPDFTSRFGEIVWAAGGVGFGWWPACIYDPRLTVGSARQLARKFLGKKQLVYFFECHDAPFSVLVNSRLTNWESGLIDDYHLGKAARSAGKHRAVQFDHALQAATVEHGKPVEFRLEWNHEGGPEALPAVPKVKRKTGPKQPQSKVKRGSPAAVAVAVAVAAELTTEEKEAARGNTTDKKLHRSIPFTPSPNRSNLKQALLQMSTHGAANEIESSEDWELYCAILKKKQNEDDEDFVESVGFVKLRSRLTATFVDARVAVTDDIDPDCLPPLVKWKFYIPSIGPMSRKQETELGPILAFLNRTTTDPRLGDGSLRHPLKIIISECSQTIDPMELQRSKSV